MLKRQWWKLATRWRVLAHRQVPAWVRFGRILGQTRVRGARCRSATTRRIVLLAWEFPPAVTGGVYRPLSIAKYAALAGWETAVLTGPAPTPASPAGQYLAQAIPEAVTVHRIPAAERGPHPWPLPEIDGGVLNALAVYEAGCALLERGPAGIVVASGPPFHSFVAGMWLAHRFGWRLVLDYRDEWTQSPFAFVGKNSSNRAAERRCLRRADLVVFTTDSQLREQKRAFSELRGTPCATVPNGWEPSDFVAPETLSREPAAADTAADLTVGYFGNLGAMVDPAEFLRTLSNVLDRSPDLRARLRVRFVGTKSPAALAQLRQFPYRETLELVDHVPKREACRMMQSVAALLLLNSPGVHRYIQGKLYDYMASGTPILVFGEGGEMAEVVRSQGAGPIVGTRDAVALEQALRGIESFARPAGPRVREWLESRRRELVAAQMLQMLDQIRT